VGETSFPIPNNEVLRLAVLDSYQVMDTFPEQVYDDFTQLASVISGCPTAMVSLVDDHRQWFKSRIGFDEDETSREIAFCAHAIVNPHELMVVPDATLDDRFSSNPMVTSDRHIRFYAGAPLVTPSGEAVGTICVMDQRPRELSSEQSNALMVLSRQVVAQLELRRNIASLEQVLLEKGLQVVRMREYQREVEEVSKVLRAQSMTDALTGVGNRRALEERLDEEYRRAQRYGVDCSLVIVDVDYFKDYNDTLGHLAGDHVLTTVAALLKSVLREYDYLARFGGDEFVAILPNTDGVGAMVMGERFRRTINGASWGDKTVTVSVGTASVHDGIHKVQGLFKEADQALFRAKREGRNRVNGSG
jgi:diguanylate cyclase (GGDEF)-like protein